MRLTKRELAAAQRPSRYIPFKHGTLDAVEIASAYKDGMSANRLAYETGATEALIRKVLVSQDVTIRSKRTAATAHRRDV